MKTTNLIIDFIIIGVLSIVAIIGPLLIINSETFDYLWKIKWDNPVLILASGTIIIYILGIIYYQLSDYGLKIFNKILFLDSIKNAKGEVKKETGYNYHNALQMVVLYSKNSFEYLSYRRTILRIIRALIFSSLVFIILHIFYSMIIYLFFDYPLFFSLRNLLIIMSIILLGVFFRFTYIKQYNGYFSAIIIFTNLIKENKKNEIQN